MEQKILQGNQAEEVKPYEHLLQGTYSNGLIHSFGQFILSSNKHLLSNYYTPDTVLSTKQEDKTIKNPILKESALGRQTVNKVT